MIDTILTLNAGSSSVKFSLFTRDAALNLLAHGEIKGIGTRNPPALGEGLGEEFSVRIYPALPVTGQNFLADPAPSLSPRGGEKNLPSGTTHEEAVRYILDWVHGHENGWTISLVAHRIVHGGTEFTEPVRVTSDIFHKLKLLCPLAPLHQPHNLAALGIAERHLPHVPQIACFDTAFHAKHDPLFSTYALPQELRNKGIRRYGFHGLSYEWIAEVLKKDYPSLAKDRVIAAHLGNGASVCAMMNGKSIDTTMGMTALDGLPMGTRSGALDPAAVIYMIRDLGLSANDVAHTFYEQSGLKGLSGISNDVKTLLENPDPRAKFALDYFALKVAQYMAMLAVSIGGIDAIVFTGGIGENATAIREAVLDHLTFIGKPQSLVIPANEERMMAMQASGYKA